MRPGWFGSNVERGVHKTSIVINYFGITVLFLMMLVVTIDVGGRYLFHSPFTGAFDVIEMMMVVLVFSSLAYCALAKGHTRVDIIHGRVPKRAQGILDIITFLPSMFIVALIAWRLGDRALGILHKLPGPTTLTLEIPHWPLLILASLGCLLFFLELLTHLFHSIKQAKSGV